MRRRPPSAEYEEFSSIGRCPECNGKLVESGGCEITCASCGIVVAVNADPHENQSPNGNVSEPLGSYAFPPPPAWEEEPRWWRNMLNPNTIRHAASIQNCSSLVQRVSEKLMLPKSVARNAVIVAGRLSPARKSYNTTVPAVAAFSLLFACRSGGITRVGSREILSAFSDAGHNVSKSQLLRLGMESALPMPKSRVEDLVVSVIRSLQHNDEIASRIREAKLDVRAYFTGLLETSKDIAAGYTAVGGYSPRTVAVASVYLAGLRIGPKIVRQRDAAHAFGIAEYTVREFCARVRRQIETR